MKFIYTLLILFSASVSMISQSAIMEKENSTLPYADIGEYPESYASGNIIARMIDGLGYRYYWATDSLTNADLSYTISEDSRSTDYTLEHLYGLSKFILSVISSDPSIREVEEDELEWVDIRKNTLKNLKEASDKVSLLDEEGVSELKIVFRRGDNVTELPVWHLINGPISDAIYHVGQIVAFRRASGNPLNPNVSVFSGKNRG
ncbi:hypothetical protein N9L92_01240 [Saprospiraceae bacterium]|nr:hypothetical protein [Saprospiraceae bacterium]